MGIVIRQSIKSVFVTLIGVLLGALITVLSMEYFPKTELGFQQNLIKITIMVSYLGLYGFNTTLLIFGQRYPPGHPSRGTFLSLTLIAPLILTLLVCASYYFLKNYVGLIYSKETDVVMMEQYFFLFPMLTFLVAAISWLEGYLQSLHKTALQNFAREVLARIIYITLIVLYATGVLSFGQFLWLYVITYLIPFCFLLMIALRNPGFRFEIRKDALFLSEVKEIFRFSGYHMLTVVSTVLILQLDAVLLAPLDRDGFDALAVYSIAVLAVSMLRNPTRVIGIAVTPAFTKSYNEGDMLNLADMFRRSAINMQIIACAMIALVYLNINNIQEMIAFIKHGYDEVKWLIMILMLGQFSDMVTGLNYELIGVTRFYRFNFWIAIIFVTIVLVLNLLLIQRMGIYGAAWATTIGLVIFNISKTVFLWYKMNLQPFSRKTWTVMLSVLLIAGVCWIIPYTLNVIVDTAIRSIVFCVLLWIVLYKTAVSPEINGLTSNIIRKRKLF
jgi:O-antigen/teichoic acid export membrane protein